MPATLEHRESEVPGDQGICGKSGWCPAHLGAGVTMRNASGYAKAL